MNRIALSLIICGLFMLLNTTNAQAQLERTCFANEHLDQLMQNDPSLEEQRGLIEIHTKQVANRPFKDNLGLITIPVVIHVLYSNNAENISDAQINSQIQILNEDFRRLNADAANTPAAFQGVASDTEIEFCLATTDPQGNSTTGITRTQSNTTWNADTDNMKFTSAGGIDAWNTGEYLNMWVCNLGGGLLGYAQFPGGPANTDGVVMLTTAFGNTGNVSAPFDLGRTTTHEVGHWLNLYHIWGDGGCGVDDNVTDTPASDASNFGCATGHVSCGSTDMVENYMDYSNDACMNLFTEGQKTRMRALFETGGSKVSLLNSAGCGSVTTPTCSDNIMNGDETGVDCGGSNCDPCAATCTDGVMNGDETGIDCGGSNCDSCAATCTDGVMNGDETGIDCGGSNCDPCAATCTDGVMNGDETGVDCGGSNCDPCAATCTDGVMNGDETGIDCGGSNCDPCGGGGGDTCDAEGLDSSYEYISNVQLDGQTNVSGDDNGYGNYTNVTFQAEENTTVNLTLTPTFSSASYEEYWNVWIDYNQDGDYDDAGELAFANAVASSDPVSGTIDLPANAVLGTTDMRVMMKWGAPITDACETFEYGEVEDYTFEVTEASAPAVCEPPSNNWVDFISTDKVRIRWTAIPDALKYQVRYRVQGSGSAWLKKNGKKNKKVLKNLSPGTTYQYRLRTKCADGWTVLTPIATVTTNGASRFEAGANTNIIETGVTLNLYPNPASNMVNIEYESFVSGGVTLSVYDITGRLVSRQDMDNEGDVIAMDIADLQNGYYFVEVSNGQEKTVQKLAKF